MTESSAGVVRQRPGKTSVATKIFKELDAFPKVPEDYQKTSTSGGTVSILVFAFIAVLVVSEVHYFMQVETKYDYEVDKDRDHEKIRINIDMTVAMDCDDLGADVLDLSGTSIDTEQDLRMEPAYFKMSKKQQQWWNVFQKVKAKEDLDHRTLNEVLELSAHFGKAMPTYMPPQDKTEFEGKETDACRIYGSLSVNKVTGNYHVTAGKSIPHPRGHAHLSSLVSELNYNFSHRIDLFSFGDPHPGIVNPLDGDLQITGHGYEIYSYYIKIVPTQINTSTKKNFRTNQYSVTQRNREVNHMKGSHGVPGLFFKYDITPFGVRVTEEEKPFSQFLVRLCGIVGGIFATSGMLHGLIGFLTDCLMGEMERRQKRNLGLPVITQEQAKKIAQAQPTSQQQAAALPTLGQAIPALNLHQSYEEIQQTLGAANMPTVSLVQPSSPVGAKPPTIIGNNTTAVPS